MQINRPAQKNNKVHLVLRSQRFPAQFGCRPRSIARQILKNRDVFRESEAFLGWIVALKANLQDYLFSGLVARTPAVLVGN